MFQISEPRFNIEITPWETLLMSYCPNPDCPNPINPDLTMFCRACGTKLVLAQRYRLVKLIGTGGFGRTLLALDEFKPSKPQCVVKQFYPQSQQNSEKANQLFQQEAIRLEQLGKHSQIPELFAHFEQENRQYIVQEFIDGQNLTEELAEQGRFSESAIVSLLEDLLPVLDFVHKGKVIHRDIKPENIIRRRHDRKLVLVDFGAAKYATGTTLNQTGTTIGTKGYAAPEQTFGKAVFASDLYSLGVTCIHLLTTREPFEMYDAMESTFVWREYLGINKVSDRLATVLDKAIESSVRRRYQSAEDLIQGLKATPSKVSRTITPQSRSPAPTPQRAIATVRVSTPPITVSEIGSLVGHGAPVKAVAISANGQLLVSGSRSGVKWWQLHEGQELPTLRSSWPEEPFAGVSALAFSPDGRLLAAGSGGGAIALWDVTLRRILRLLKAPSGVKSVAFSPDGRLLAAGGTDGAIALWESSSWRLFPPLMGHSAAVNSVAFSPDRRTLVSGSEDTSIVFWDVTTQADTQTGWGRSGSVNAIAISPCGRFLASGCANRTILLWELPSGQQLGTLTGHSTGVNSVAFSPDGATLASGSDDTSIVLWDVKTGQEKRTCWGRSGVVYAVAFTPDGNTLVSGTEDTTVKIWQLRG
jgi:WD40 repeat protein